MRVESGDIHEVTIESLGDQGNGIAKIDCGYVVIVPGTRPRVRDDNRESDDALESADSFANETLNDDE